MSYAMKVLMAHNWYFVGGGADRVFFETVKLLEAHEHMVIPFSMKDKRNYASEYHEYFPDEIDYSKIQLSVRNLKTAASMIYSSEANEKINALINKTKPDIAHLHNIYGRLTPSILYALKKNNVPVVMTLHDFKLICPAYNMLRDGNVCEICKDGKYYRCIATKCHKRSYLASLVYALEAYIYSWLKTYLKHIRYFVTPSMFMRNKLIEFGIPQEKLVHIPNFVAFYSVTPNYDSKSYLLYSGKLLRTKGLKTLLKAIQELPDIEVHIAGSGDMREELEEFVKDNKIRNVKFLGHLGEKELHQVLADARFVILPTECYENAPMSVLEAFSHGKPVVGANIAGIPEMVIEGQTGLLFEPGNHRDLKEKIIYLLGNPSKVIELGKNARKKIESEYNTDLHYERLMTLYKRACA
jgi:glycosyltransferase involved in cell wall biosynthesis